MERIRSNREKVQIILKEIRQNCADNVKPGSKTSGSGEKKEEKAFAYTGGSCYIDRIWYLWHIRILIQEC